MREEEREGGKRTIDDQDERGSREGIRRNGEASRRGGIQAGMKGEEGG